MATIIFVRASVVFNNCVPERECNRSIQTFQQDWTCSSNAGSSNKTGWISVRLNSVWSWGFQDWADSIFSSQLSTSSINKLSLTAKQLSVSIRLNLMESLSDSLLEQVLPSWHLFRRPFIIFVKTTVLTAKVTRLWIKVLLTTSRWRHVTMNSRKLISNGRIHHIIKACIKIEQPFMGAMWAPAGRILWTQSS